MTKQQRLGCSVLVAACLAFLLLGSLAGPMTGDICQKDEYTGKKDCSSHNVILVTAWQTGKFLDEHAGGISAVATAFLAYITMGLWSLGRKQEATTRAQMRAYLSVSVGTAVCQDREKGLKFSGNPVLRNNGQTPAYKVRYSAKADIIPDTLIDNYNFAFAISAEVGEASIGPGEHRDIIGVAQQFVPDTEIADIKAGTGKSLWTWGTVHYEDAFGNPHYVNFSQRLVWLANDTIYAFYGTKFSGSD